MVSAAILNAVNVMIYPLTCEGWINSVVYMHAHKMLITLFISSSVLYVSVHAVKPENMEEYLKQL